MAVTPFFILANVEQYRPAQIGGNSAAGTAGTAGRSGADTCTILSRTLLGLPPANLASCG
ncbi:hypothetical protein BJF84_08250 [Rhodococcus sp. CUA-806]|nr:hypothetical protein BJF84_08250 [Rhodococcus sp. CUA-806]